jgi:hypothetical protein
MSQDVRQWLSEIKLLQQRLAEAKQERDEALASAANWRGLYETEAKQRRAETAQTQQTIAQLEEQITSLKGIPAHLLSSVAPANQAAIEQEINQLEGESALKEKVVAALMERDRLIQALKAEQIAHEETRRGLTTALGDTVDRLYQERNRPITDI